MRKMWRLRLSGWISDEKDVEVTLIWVDFGDFSRKQHHHKPVVIPLVPHFINSFRQKQKLSGISLATRINLACLY
jgi:hypothetical protein